ncbi:hypothetical protein TCAL_17146 [Tigriopus californicus]|uniref:Myosin tail domain-containing protein n=1 Tax=Tigriopus californicus TaxID=6832 RepID=A0A553P2M9_TIGCA|nr:hypothetical protein TCAL_17146 [Tigriopus californicus]
MESRLAAAEQEKVEKDDQIRNLKEELEHQTDMISKLGREEKGVQESKQKTEEDVQTLEDKCSPPFQEAQGQRLKKSRAMLKKDLEDLGSRLEEAGANTATQVELNKKREQELHRLKAEIEERNISHEGTLAALQ